MENRELTQVVRARELQPGMRVTAIRARHGKQIVYGPRGGRRRVQGVETSEAAVVRDVSLTDSELRVRFEKHEAIVIARRDLPFYVADIERS